MVKKNKKETKGKKLSRIVTLVLGLGFAGSTLAIALSSVFSQNNSNNVASNPNDPSLEEQIQVQVRGYEKVLEREPQNVTALEGLAQIYLQSDPKKAIPTLEKLVEYYPEQPEYAGILELIEQQETNQPQTDDTPSESEPVE
jgi:hypothetical protein